MVAAAGIDTWSPCWYVEPESKAARAMEALATVPTKRGRFIPDSIDGHRVGWFPRSHLVVAEGHPGGEVLGLPAELGVALRRLESATRDVGVPLPTAKSRVRWGDGARRPGLAGIRRLDATVDVELPADEGRALLTCMAALAPPRLASVVHRETGGRAVETVSWQGSRGKLARVYDKGIEANSAPRGTRLRLEAQYRWPADHRRDPAEMTASYVRDKFAGRFAPLWRATKG